MTIQEWLVSHKKELAWGLAGFVAAVLIWLFFFYLPAPKLVDQPASTKEATVTILGKASSRVAVAAFDKSGNLLLAVNTDDKGEFVLNNLPVGEGETRVCLRAVSSGWRASFPKCFSVRKDTVAPALSVSALQGATVTGSSTVVSGKAEPGSSVTVNGVKTTVAADGSWSATVALTSGANTLTVSATDGAGNNATETQTIQYTPASASSLVGTASVTASSTTLGSGSSPAPVPAADGATSTSTAAPASSPTAPATQSVTPSPAPQPVLAITSSAWVSNPSPNERANETIYASVKDNYGRPVTDASVIASVYFPSGMVNYGLRHVGGGTYSASFKLNDKYNSGYRVNVEVVSRLAGFVSSAATSFLPQ